LELDRPVPVVPGGLIIGSKFDTDIHSNTCRIAFRGNIQRVYENENYFSVDLPQLKVFKVKRKVTIYLYFHKFLTTFTFLLKGRSRRANVVTVRSYREKYFQKGNEHSAVCKPENRIIDR
jgi:hypothetical protein